MNLKDLKMPKSEKKKGVNPLIVVTAAGLVVGAGIAAATTLKDKKTRTKVKKLLSDAKDQAVNYASTLRAQQSKVEKGTGKVKKVVRKAKTASRKSNS